MRSARASRVSSLSGRVRRVMAISTLKRASDELRSFGDERTAYIERAGKAIDATELGRLLPVALELRGRAGDDAVLASRDGGHIEVAQVRARSRANCERSTPRPTRSLIQTKHDGVSRCAMYPAISKSAAMSI